MDERIVGKLQSDLESIRSDITDMKIDIRELRGDVKAANERAEIAAVRTESKNASDAIVARMDAGFESMEKTLRLLNTRNIVVKLSIGAGILGAVAKMLKLF